MSKVIDFSEKTQEFHPKRHLYVVFNEVKDEPDSVCYLFPDEYHLYFSMLANDVTSKYYFNLEDYTVIDYGEVPDFEKVFDEESCDPLISFVDDRRRDLQTIIQTINFLPNGYFKMPKEMQEEVQRKINEACTKYASDYITEDDIKEAVKSGKVVIE